MKKHFVILLALAASFSFCNRHQEKQAEEIPVDLSEESSDPADSSMSGLQGNVSMKQIASYPNQVLLTGMRDHRLVSIYRTRQIKDRSGVLISKLYHSSGGNFEDENEHFMPGIDVLFGYNLLNIAHYEISTEKMNLFFKKPVFVKSLYYPAVVQDSVDKKPIIRNYYLLSVYDEDTNRDSVLNKKDLRHFYHFDSTARTRTQLIPADYSVMRSQYDRQNDLMYIFARHDSNHNGSQDKDESVHVFWISLKDPKKAKQLY